MSTAHRMLNPLYSAAYRDKVLSYSPIAYWMLGEKTGTVAYDEVTDAGHTDTGQSGDHSVSSLGNAGIGDGNTCPEYDGTNDYTNIASVAFRSAFNGVEGSLFIWCKVSGVGVWTDTVARRTLSIGVNASNRLYLAKLTTNNQLYWIYTAGATNETYTKSAVSTVDWFAMGMSWSKAAEEAKFYYFDVGGAGGLESTSTTLGTWAGTTTAEFIGAGSAAPASPWSGGLAHCMGFDYPLREGAFQNLAVI